MSKKSRVLITGGAGFVGSNLCERFLEEGWQVIAVDNTVTGTSQNLVPHFDNPDFTLLDADVAEPLEISEPLDMVMHFASIASPVDYLKLQVETLRAGSIATFHTLDLARSHGARYLFSSTSEVYGDPQVYPQPESYWGNVNPIGPRSMYDESKRFGEAVVMAYHRSFGIDTRIFRFFNCYGPGMRLDDGRVVAAFCQRALTGRPIEIYGDGEQTRSLCYITDMIDAIWRVSQGPGLEGEVFNVGNPDERTMLELAELVLEYTGSDVPIEYFPGRPEDPQRRCPDISHVRERIGWEPTTSLGDGIRKTIAHYRALLEKESPITSG